MITIIKNAFVNKDTLPLATKLTGTDIDTQQQWAEEYFIHVVESISNDIIDYLSGIPEKSNSNMTISELCETYSIFSLQLEWYTFFHFYFLQIPASHPLYVFLTYCVLTMRMNIDDRLHNALRQKASERFNNIILGETQDSTGVIDSIRKYLESH
jgi:hypothetical protein